VLRPAVLVAVLLGLFLMHGGPAAAGGGCHGAMADLAVAHPMPAAMAAHTAGPPRTSPGVKAAAHPQEALRGELCRATTPRPGIPLPPLGAVAFVLPAAVPLPWPRRRPGEARRRGPPGGGRDLLLQVCVART
jgi:hypothetical protein